MISAITAGLIVYLLLVILSLLFDAKSFINYMKDKLIFIDDRGEYCRVVGEEVFHWLLMAMTMMLLIQIVLDKFWGHDE